MLDLDDQILVTLTADADTPNALKGYDGLKLSLPPGTAVPTGHDVIRLGGVSIPGFSAPGAGTTLWMMTAARGPLYDMVAALPGAGGWHTADGHQVYESCGMTMLSAGVTQSDVKRLLRQLYAAAQAELIARQAG